MTIPTQSPSDISGNQDTVQGTDASATVLPPISAVLEGLDHMEIDDHPGKCTDSLGTAIEMLLTKRDMLSSKISNMVIKGTDGDDVDALVREVDRINKRIDALRSCVAPSKEETRAGVRLTKRDIPKFQLKAQGANPFPGEETYGTVEQFLRAFEKVMDSTDNDVQLVWRKYIPLALSLDFDAWLRNDLLVCDSWEAAKAVFVKTFGNSLLRLESRRAVMTMRMRGNETVSEYGLRFGRAVADAGYDRMESILGDVFLCGFPESWQVQINTVLASIHHGETAWSFQDIAAAAQSVFGDRRSGGVFGAGTSSSKWASFGSGSASGSGSGSGSGVGSGAGPSKRRRTGDGDRTSGSSGSGSGRRFFCSKHGGNKASHNEEDCYSGKGKGKAPEPDRCRYCGKTWTQGHRCSEYLEAKAKNMKRP